MKSINREIKIREYNIKDKSKLIEILRLNIPKYFHESEIEDFSSYLENKIEKYFVSELNGEIVGSGGVNFEDNYKIGRISWDFIKIGRASCRERVCMMV